MKPRLIGLMLIATLTLTATTTASAISFKPSKAGTVKLTGEGIQKLQITGGPTVECETLTGSTSIGAAERNSIVLLVKYGKCTMAGNKVTVSTGTILLDANGSVRLPGGTSLKIVLTPSIGGCSLLFQSEDESTIKLLGTVKYTNTGGKIRGVAEPLEGLSVVVHAPAGNTTCGGANGTLLPFTLTGTFITELEGGTITVK